MQLYFATRNPGKVNSLKRDFEPYGVTVTPIDLDLPEPRSDDVQEIAKHKVMHAYNQLKAPVIAIDAGFYIHSLNGFPRAFVNFALETIGLDGIVGLVQGKDRKCEFRECLAYMDNRLEEPLCFLGTVEGVISQEKRGIKKAYHWSELSEIFIPKGGEKTLAELEDQEYAEWRKTKADTDSAHKNFVNWYVENRQKNTFF